MVNFASYSQSSKITDNIFFRVCAVDDTFRACFYEHIKKIQQARGQFLTYFNR